MRARGLRAIAACAGATLALAAAGQVDVPVGERGEPQGKAGAQNKKNKLERVEIREFVETIPAPVVYEFSRTVGPGRLVLKQEGVPGKVIRAYAYAYEGDKFASKELVSTRKVEATPTLYWMGRSGYYISRGSFTRGKVLDMEATAYDPSAGRGKSATFRTKSGERAEYGVVAVDPTVIPLGTMLFIEGYGFARASDVGSAIKGNRIDLCLDTYREAIQFGRRMVRVHILK